MIALMRVAVGESCAAQDHDVVEQRAVAILSPRERRDKFAEQPHVMAIDLSDLLDEVGASLPTIRVAMRVESA